MERATDEDPAMRHLCKTFFLLTAILLLAFMVYFVSRTPAIMINQIKETVAIGGSIFAAFLASALLLIRKLQTENRSLKQQLVVSMSTDTQTGLLNRNSFKGMLESEMSRTLRYDMTFSLALLDIDGLKMINDFFSREAGDLAIVKTGDFIQSKIRDVDTLFYLNGGVYALLLPSTPLSGGFILMSRLRQQLEEANFDFKGQELAVTASFGITEFDRKKDDSASIFNRVENLVLKAKKLGRNRVC